MDKAKPFCIAKRDVWEAYKRVKANQGAAGVDRQSIAEFEADLEGNLYRIWNRMSSGSYFPLPVRRVEIPKDDGRTRPLGIPTVADRVAQMVAQRYLEPLVEPVFHENSYGYRPGRSALDALRVARQRCWRYDWVLDLDIKSFFDEIDWELLLRAVRRHTDCKWVLLYIERWLKAPVQRADGTLVSREKGTAQGTVITPWTQKRTVAVRRRRPAGTRRRLAAGGRARRYRDRVADGDCVVTDEHLFDQQTNDTLTLSHVQRLCRRGQPGHERGQCLGQPQMGRAVFCLVDNGLQFGFERLLSPSQFRCSGPPSGWQWCAPPSAA